MTVLPLFGAVHFVSLLLCVACPSLRQHEKCEVKSSRHRPEAVNLRKACCMAALGQCLGTRASRGFSPSSNKNVSKKKKKNVSLTRAQVVCANSVVCAKHLLSFRESGFWSRQAELPM